MDAGTWLVPTLGQIMTTTLAAHRLPPLRLLAVGLHALMAGLLVIAVLRSDRAWAWVAGLVMGVWYAVGVLSQPGWGNGARASWVTALLGSWTILLVASVDAVWLAFPLFFVVLHLLPRPTGLVAVAATTLAAVAAYAWHDRFTAASVIGPLIGAGVAVGTVAGYEALVHESAQRQRLLDEVTSARETLAAREREAGAHGERERLAREIHDTLAQGLTSIQLLLRAAERDVETSPASSVARIAQARITAWQNLQEARRFVRALPPPGLEGRTLPDALRELVTGPGITPSVMVTVTGPESPVPPGVAAAALRIAQSAVGNAVEHARATRVSVTLTYLTDELALDVVDDGVGFDPGQLTAPGAVDRGHGLEVMRARARASGGGLAVESEPGAGTAVAATFPVAAG